MTIRVVAQTQPEKPPVEADIADVERLRTSAEWVWVDLESEPAAVVEQLCTELGFDPFAVEDVLDIELLPKWDDLGSHLYVVLHALVADQDRVDTREVDIFITDRIIVTAHDAGVAGIAALRDNMARHPTALGCCDPSVVLARLAEQMGRRYLEVLVELELRIEQLDELALAGDPTVLAEVQVLRREESTIRTMLWPQRQVLASLGADDSPLLSNVGRRRFQDAYEIHNQLVESLSAARELLSNVLDTYRGATDERLAVINRVLTVYAAVMLPLTVITGFFGMNFVNLPLQESSSGWILVTLSMVLVTALSMWYFAVVGWIGSPRAQLRSRRVARGLADAASRPIAPLSGQRRHSDGTRPAPPR